MVKEARDSAAGLPVAQQRAIFHDTAKGVLIPGGRGRAGA